MAGGRRRRQPGGLSLKPWIARPKDAPADQVAFNVIAKPVGPRCNLDCGYCFYKDKAGIVGAGGATRMADDVLERFVHSYVEARRGQRITFTWQGGEPTLAGLDFFERALAAQGRHLEPGTVVENALQTNGTLLDDDWCAFLARHDFLVGVSLDGPPELHDGQRRSRTGGPSHGAVVDALHRLQSHGVRVNTLTVVSRTNVAEAHRVYAYLKGLGVRHMQFIPLVERRGADERGPAVPREQVATEVTDATPSPEAYGEFLCELFDAWRDEDVGRIHVQAFDAVLARHLGLQGGVCTFGKTCGDVMVVEWDGAVYSCDHFVQPDYRLGSLMETPLADLFRTRKQRRFGLAKRLELPRDCRRCQHLELCNGGCPKHRFVEGRDGGRRRNYLCPGYRRYFDHTRKPLRRLADRVRRGLVGSSGASS